MSDQVWTIADIHLDPGDRYTQDLHYCSTLILNGDIFNILPHGIESWRTEAGWNTIASLFARIPADSKFIMGNHEGRFSWLTEILEPFTDEIYRQYECEIDGRLWRFKHGHQFSEWWLLRHVADDVVAWAVSNSLTRDLWYQFCRDRGWIASGMPGTSEKYAPLVAGIWSLALKEAHEDRVNLSIGHTHTPGKIETPWQTVINVGCNEPVKIGGA